MNKKKSPCVPAEYGWPQCGPVFMANNNKSTVSESGQWSPGHLLASPSWANGQMARWCCDVIMAEPGPWTSNTFNNATSYTFTIHPPATGRNQSTTNTRKAATPAFSCNNTQLSYNYFRWKDLWRNTALLPALTRIIHSYFWWRQFGEQ